MLCDRWVKTNMGQSLADAVGVKEPPMAVEDSARHVLAQVRSHDETCISYSLGAALTGRRLTVCR